MDTENRLVFTSNEREVGRGNVEIEVYTIMYKISYNDVLHRGYS